MTTRHLVDPELLEFLDQQPNQALTAAELPRLRAERLAQARTQNAAQPLPPELEVRERWVPGPAGEPEVRVFVYRPTRPSGPRPALLWIHGGGYVMGTPEADDLKSGDRRGRRLRGDLR